jgi:integrase
VGQTLSYMGTPDPRLDSHGALDLRLKHQLRHYSKTDPPPRRVKPIPIQVLRHLVQQAHADSSVTHSRLAIADLVTIAYYFLMRPGEYCTSTGEDGSHPFHTDEIELWQGTRQLDLATASDNDLLTATFCVLTFSDQKNANRGEKVGHSTSGDSLFCPVRSVARRLIHLRRNAAPAHTPIHCYYEQFRGRQLRIPSSSINILLRQAASLLGYAPGDITVRALRATGAMSLITARVDSNLIRLLGRWQSDAMLRYLHVQALPVLQNFARAMHQHGQFQALPDAGVPIHQPQL